MTKTEIIKEVKEQGVEIIRFVYIDNEGLIRSYATTDDMLAGDLDKGHNFAIAMPFFSVLDEMVPDTRFGCTGEVSGVPDPVTFRLLPHVPKTAMLICDFRKKEDHSECGLCARSLLKNYLSGLDYDVNVAMENEFYLVVRDENGNYAPFDQSYCFSTTGMNRQHDVVIEMIRNLKAQGMVVEKYYPEYGQGQVEIVYKYDQALKTADNQVFFRETVKGVAQKHGIIASFMPKPFADSAGSGAHLHFSLYRDGKNLFYDPADKYGLSRTGKYFIGGLLRHLRAMCAFTASTVNSYKRLLPHHWASAYVCWGLDNREAAVRVCPGPKGSEADSFNLEIKPVDGACNPYLAVLAALAAGMDGIHHHIDPGRPVVADPHDLSANEQREMGITRLPKTLSEAVDALKADDMYKAVLGDVFFDEYILLKRFAWNRYVTHVSDWETDLYMEAF
ncbi:MAG: glutamine synthetase [Deltaproteobacteria bacterium]|nr:glutamine synthetase [Deltaproteobacteria bacterium]